MTYEHCPCFYPMTKKCHTVMFNENIYESKYDLNQRGLCHINKKGKLAHGTKICASMKT